MRVRLLEVVVWVERALHLSLCNRSACHVSVERRISCASVQRRHLARVHLASFHLLQPLIVYVDELLELFHLLLLRKAVSLELARNGVIRYWQRGW